MAKPPKNQFPSDEAIHAFVAAVNSRRSKTLDELLTQDEFLRRNIDQPWFDFDMPAVVAAKDSQEILRILIRHGADLNARSSWWAGSFGVLDGSSPEMVQFLIERGARLDIHSAAEQNKFDLVTEFLQRDSELANSRGGDGQTPLHVAASLKIVDLLLENGADPSIRCLDHSATAAQYAVSTPDKCRHLIMQGSTPDIFMACALGDRELLENVLQQEPESIHYQVGTCPHTGPVHENSHLHIYTWKLLGAKTPSEVAREFNNGQLYDELSRRL